MAYLARYAGSPPCPGCAVSNASQNWGKIKNQSQLLCRQLVWIKRMTTSAKKIVMSGMRPTGKLHLGHYVGVLKNWVTLQETHTCYFSIVDWHALTTQYDETDALQTNIDQIFIDWLASGVDPAKATLFLQSWVPEIAELHVLLSMLTPVKWLETDPTLKDMVAMVRGGENPTEVLNYGLLGYPVLQTCDILTVLGEYVPVGKDQLAHLEISRDMARRFNHLYQTELFPEIKPLLTETPLLVGLDGRKMGKSHGNAIYIDDSAEETVKKVKTAITDPGRIKREDPGTPEACVAVFPYYQIFADSAEVEVTRQECMAAQRGCMDCKKRLADIVNETMRPVRQRGDAYAADRGQVLGLLKEGSERARAVAADTLRHVRKAMKLLPR